MLSLIGGHLPSLGPPLLDFLFSLPIFFSSALLWLQLISQLGYLSPDREIQSFLSE